MGGLNETAPNLAFYHKAQSRKINDNPSLFQHLNYLSRIFSNFH